MNGITKRKAILYLSAIFIAGLLTGGVAGFAMGKRSFYRPPPPEKKMAAFFLDRLKKELNLTEEQARKAEPHVNLCSEQLRAIHAATTEKVLEVLLLTDRKLEEFLTPEQRQKLARMQKHREEGFRKGRRLHGPPKE